MSENRPNEDPNVDDLRVRLAIRDAVKYEWLYLRDKIIRLIGQLKPLLKNTESVSHLDTSFETLTKVTDSLTLEDGYVEKETSSDFRRLITELDNAMKDFFLSFTEEENISVQTWQDEEGDAIGRSTNEMYRILGGRRSVTPYDSRLEYVYPSINFLIHILRNSHSHRKTISRTKHRIRVKSLDNIFSLSSIVLLSLYSYIELLDLWLDTCRHYKMNKRTT
jgi:hypothetical protein